MAEKLQNGTGMIYTQFHRKLSMGDQEHLRPAEHPREAHRDSTTTVPLSSIPREDCTRPLHPTLPSEMRDTILHKNYCTTTRRIITHNRRIMYQEQHQVLVKI